METRSRVLLLTGVGKILRSWQCSIRESERYLFRKLFSAAKQTGFQAILDEMTLEDFVNVVEWLSAPSNNGRATEIIEKLRAEDLPTLHSLIGVERLRNAIKVWKTNAENSDEGFWQKFLKENSYFLSQALCFPVLVVQDTAYVGGKGINKRGSNILDFLVANELTQNLALIEIKTPATHLLGQAYRQDIYVPTANLVGAVQQTANYKNSLMTDFSALMRRMDKNYGNFNPPCFVIAGNTAEFENDRIKIKSFELYRNNLREVQVLTFCELFKRAENLLNLLEGNFAPAKEMGEAEDETEDSLMFGDDGIL